MVLNRIRTKIGDVFSVPVSETTKKYFQLIAFDMNMLNSDVIRAFEKEYGVNESPLISEIVNGEVEFYAHCVTKLGVKLQLWEKVGFSEEIGDTSHIVFRCSEDSGVKLGEKPVKISKRWYIWHIKDKDYTDVGILRGENRRAEIGMVMSPYNIVARMKTGEYPIEYPGFE